MQLYNITKIVNLLKSGGILCIPTDTLFAISCDATNETAIKKIYNIKKRELNKPFPIFFADFDMANFYMNFCEKEIALAKKFWPGPLTILSKIKTKSLPEILIKNNKLGVRIPNSKLIHDICSSLKRPIIATSANISKEENINDISNIKTLFNNKIDSYISGPTTPHATPSTIIEVQNNKINIIREGAIKEEELKIK
ncbi:MAG: L-threonylcarbamoyladenylate synthase [Candidatus Midichloriaceae bacterium]|jgi:L-threonylcarbamoyladenylate synthase